MKNAEVAICIPSGDEWKADFALHRAAHGRAQS